AIESGTPSAVLMERAGHAVAVTVARMLGGVYGRRVLVLAGKGNNGGDGLVAARKLHRMGASVRIALAQLPRELGGDPLAMYEKLVPLGVPVGTPDSAVIEQ
ncbi:MAG: bifunctional ADP-dependent NAD(P)H-hydrate dehydratase/NAD(P)H-hydrate epimerase, partial [Acidimicrobiia bacterium]